MAFYGYRDDVDNCYSTPYSNTFGPNPVQASTQYSSAFEFGEYNSSAYHRDDSFVTSFESNHPVYTYSELQYEPIEYHPCYNYYEYSVNPLETHYSQPKFLQYEPPNYSQGYLLSENKFTISYSSVEFNEPEFEEYDPTPYGGGYDPAKTYGKPLPPSDITCYPRTVPQSDVENFSYASIPSPYGRDDDLPTKPPHGSKPIDTENGGKVTSGAKDVEIVEPPNDDSQSYEHENGFENRTRGGDYGYGSERQVPNIPYGSGLEAIDLCESIFGHWPCLAKLEQEQEQRRNCQVCDQERKFDPWKSAADYLFGSPVVYDYENYHHHHHQLQYEYDRSSW